MASRVPDPGDAGPQVVGPIPYRLVVNDGATPVSGATNDGSYVVFSIQ